jgi:two-component system sensor histidine kinase/response regulator
MPGLDGLQASRRIKEDGSLARKPAIVLVTAFGREEVREEAERMQLDGFLVKPVTKSMLVDTLVNLFAEAGPGGTIVGAAADEGAGRLQGARILLAEDNEINQQIAVELLEGAGAAVRVTGNGREAVQALLDGPQPPPFDVVLMDLQMPEMDGYQATARLRAEPAFAHLPIVAMTAHATIEERQRCLGAGMNDHIAKPIDPAVLFDTLGRYYRPPGATEASPPSPATPQREAAPGAGPAEGEVPLPAVAGLDTADGLRRVAGNRRLYLKLVRQFVGQQAPVPAQIAEAMAVGDHQAAERLAHTLRGVAGNLGAEVVRAAAAALEQAVVARAEAGAIEALRERLAGELDGLIGRLRSALGEEPAPAGAPPPPADPEALRDIVSRMRAQLDQFDPAAADLLDDNRELFRALLAGDDFAEFERHVQGYAFADAQAMLERAAAARGV